MLTQIYSSKRTLGLSQLGFDRLEVLEDLVHVDRVRDGKTFFDCVRMAYIRDTAEIGDKKGPKQEHKRRVLRMM